MPGVSLSDYRSNIDDILTTPDPEKNKHFENSNDVIELGLKHISENGNLMDYVTEPTGYSVPKDQFVKPDSKIF